MDKALAKKYVKEAVSSTYNNKLKIFWFLLVQFVFVLMIVIDSMPMTIIGWILVALSVIWYAGKQTVMGYFDHSWTMLIRQQDSKSKSSKGPLLKRIVQAHGGWLWWGAFLLTWLASIRVLHDMVYIDDEERREKLRRYQLIWIGLAALSLILFVMVKTPIGPFILDMLMSLFYAVLLLDIFGIIDM